MNRMKKNLFMSAIVLIFVSISTTNASAKTIKTTLKKGNSSVIKVTTMKKIKKITTKSNKKSIATVKKISNKKIRITAKKTGKAKITVKIYKNKKKYQKFVYQVMVKPASNSKDDDTRITQKKSHRKQTKTTPAPTKRPRPTRDPAPTLEPTAAPAQESKYSYEMEILNAPDNRYNRCKILIYTKTDNPNIESMELEGWDSYESCIGYDDVHCDTSGNVGGAVGNKVDGGYLAAITFKDSGRYTVTLTEKINGVNIAVASLDIELADVDAGEKDWSDQVLEWAKQREQDCDELVTMLVDNKSGNSSFQLSAVLTQEEANLLCEGLYNRYDEWNEFSCISYQELQEYLDLPCEVKLAKMIGAYIYKYYNYTKHTETYYPNLLSKYMNPVWKNKCGISCWDATSLLEIVLEDAGIQMEWGTPENNEWHRYGIVIVNGQEYIVDAQPRTETGLITEWDYIL